MIDGRTECEDLRGNEWAGARHGPKLMRGRVMGRQKVHEDGRAMRWRKREAKEMMDGVSEGDLLAGGLTRREGGKLIEKRA